MCGNYEVFVISSSSCCLSTWCVHTAFTVRHCFHLLCLKNCSHSHVNMDLESLT